MPRSARLDLPGLLQHVMVRGIDRKDIFLDDRDRGAFGVRLGELLVDTGTDCLAWALMSNHFHLLLRPNEGRLGPLMRRLLTGHAVRFNLRHDRQGHLFQNRYKSIVCEEEPYLLELVRYIHLNPLRAGLVSTLEQLATYPWSGHAVVLGNHQLPGQATEEVLGRFGSRVGPARRQYTEFVAAGVEQGQREELVGGGLRRSLALLGKTKERESYDERILGSGEFVDQLHQEETLHDRTRPSLTLPELVEHTGRCLGIAPDRVYRRSKDGRVSDARGLTSFVATAFMGATSRQVGELLGLSQSGVSRNAARGRAVWNRSMELRQRFRDLGFTVPENLP